MTNQPISSSFWRGLTTVSAVVVGVIYISSHITDTINEAVKPMKEQVEAIKSDIKTVKSDVESLKPKVSLSEYRIGLHEQLFKEIVSTKRKR